MKVAYHFTIPRPAYPELDAAIQDALKLSRLFPGDLSYLYPAPQATRLIPRFLCGLTQLPQLIKLDQQVELHQFYSNEFYPFPILNLFKKPIVYTIVTSLQPGDRPWHHFMLSPVAQFVVSSPAEQMILQRWGIANVQVIPPGIEVNRFASVRPSAIEESDGAFVLLAGSAPWNLAQFDSKGVTLLLQVAQAMPNLRLIFLWRGVLFEEISRRVRQANLTDRVEIINQRVAIPELLRRVQAAIVLADKPALIKAYPHSLLEALAAGKPVIVSRGLAMADYVQQTGCGEIVPNFTFESLQATINRVSQHYPQYRHAALTIDIHQFSINNLLTAYSKLYHHLTTVT